MATKPIHVSEELHRRVKLAATMADKSIKEWTEAVLADALDKRLIDAKEDYHVEPVTD